MSGLRAALGGRLLIATHNRGKLEEFRALLAPYGIAVTGAADHGLAEPAETETTFAGNARIKARAALSATGLPVLADDSGIEVAALDGRPGVHTADWAMRPDGSRDFRMAMERTWAELEAARAPLPRHAAFRATLVLALPDGSERLFEGRADGTLTWPPRGAEGHGYDPMFVPEGQPLTFAEMSAAEKNRVSHRADALTKFIAALEE